MAITDINISEELVTNAPSIKYRGEEGPKSPQEMEKMVDLDLLREQYEQYLYDLEEQKPGFPPMSFEEFAISIMGDQSKGPVLPNDPTKPIQPFQPKPQGPVLPDRQMAAYGGIMGRDGRKQYGLGSFLKKTVRKIIPNEVADIAVKAAPFIAPFNPLAAGIASGLGSFDQTGSITSGLKSGLMNYGLGQGARYLGGADFQGLQNPFSREAFSMPTGEGGIKNLTEKFFPKNKEIEAISGSDFEQFKEPVFGKGDALGGEMLTTATDGGEKIIKEKAPLNVKKLFEKSGMNTKALLGILGLSAAAGAYTAATSVDDVLTDVQRGSGLDSEIPSGILSIRTEVIEAMKDPSGKKLAALRTKYPFLGTQASKDVANMAMGGRIGFNRGLLAGPTPQQRQAEQAISTSDLDNFIDAGQGIKLYVGQPIIKNYYSKEDSGRRNEAFFEIIDPETGSMSTISEVDFYEKYGKPNANGGRIGFKTGLLVPEDEMTEKTNQMILQMHNRGADIDTISTITEKDAAYINSIISSQNQKAEGGIMDLGGMEKDYRAEGGFVPIGKQEKADDVPARLSVNEFVFTADAVRNAGGGDIDKGAEVMENMMKNLEAGGRVSEESQGMGGAQQMFEVSERLSEVI